MISQMHKKIYLQNDLFTTPKCDTFKKNGSAAFKAWLMNSAEKHILYSGHAELEG